MKLLDKILASALLIVMILQIARMAGINYPAISSLVVIFAVITFVVFGLVSILGIRTGETFLSSNTIFRHQSPKLFWGAIIVRLALSVTMVFCLVKGL